MERRIENVIHEGSTAQALTFPTPILAMEGPDAQDLLQRISTNDLSRLSVGDVVHTIFTNEKGRIVDVAAVLKTEEKRLVLVGQSTNPHALIHWIEKFIIMEDVQMSSLDKYSHSLFWGAMSALESVNVVDGRFNEIKSVAEEKSFMFAETWDDGRIVHVIGPRDVRARLIVGETGEVSRAPEPFDGFRVRHGIPWIPNELSIETNPLEAGLRRYVSFTKGCYVGQEVIARLDTYAKVRQKLVRFRFDESPTNIPTAVFNTDGQVGKITTISQAPDASGLGFVGTAVGSTENLFFRVGERVVPTRIEEIGDR
jgi:folate-binding protein YgfZ